MMMGGMDSRNTRNGLEAKNEDSSSFSRVLASVA